MFGISAFAQSPFASLGTNNYAFTITEDILAVEDLLPYVVTFVKSITEDVSYDNSSSQFYTTSVDIVENVEVTTDSTVDIAQFFLSLSEDLTSDDFYTITAAFSSSVTENIDVTDSYFAGKINAASITEGITSDDVRSMVPAYTVSVTENIGMTNAQTNQFAYQAIVAENINILDNIEVAGWVKIDTDQTPSWIVINNL